MQIADGGLNNISQLLDRASTLATESASGTFTGDRNVLNSEFQSVLTEINRQAQSIGLNTGGQFAKNLSVFIGGGEASNGISAINNGSVSVDLTKSTVDSKSLGLQGVQSIGVAGTDIGPNSGTSVSKILANTTNTGSEQNTGFTKFYVTGPGFSGTNQIALNVNLSGVTDGNTLVTAVNNAIQAAGQGGTQYATAFQSANITAALNTDSAGKTQLTFASSNTAFQVQAGDRAANALMGNVASSTDPTGDAITTTVAAPSAMVTATAAENNVQVQIQGAGMSGPQTLSINIASAETAAQMAAALQSAVTSNSALSAAGISITNNSGTLNFASTSGKQFTVQAGGDTNNFLGLGSFLTGASNAVSYTTITAGAAYPTVTAGTENLQFSLNGAAPTAGSTISLTLTAAETEAATLSAINAAIVASPTLEAAGLKAVDNSGEIQISSGNGTNFSLNAYGTSSTGIGFGTTGVSSTVNTATAPTANPYFDAQGTTQTGALDFKPVIYGSDNQTLSFSATDTSGAAHTVSVTLNSGNAGSLDQALSTINTAIQATNDTTLQQIAAVGEDSSGTQKINFISNLGSFNLTLGNVGATAGTEGVGDSSAQGTVVKGAQTGTGGTANISNQASAEAAVTALSNAVQSLGSAQAVVGRGENQFTYATNLAQSQLTNTQSAESTIRDADLASQAANLTKAQILIQAGVAALAQANSAPQQILSLLSGH